MAGQLLKPGVEVVQSFQTASSSFVRPTLVPCVVGPAFEVVNILSSDGTVNSKARWGAYAQLGRTITQSAFPDPRGNVDELDILESSIRPFLMSAGNLAELPMDPGDAFLCTSHTATRAALKTAAFGAGLAIGGLVLQLAIDQPVQNDTSDDVVITFSGTTLTAAQAAAQINTAVGQTVAFVVETSKVLIASPTWGAKSSVTVRMSGSANQLLGIGYETAAARHERVVGAGFYGEDDNDSDLQTPWIAHSKGGFFAGTVYPLTEITESVPAKMGTIAVGKEPADFVASTAGAAVTFGSAGTIPLEVGDYFFADGLRVKGGEVMKVEENRFKVGTINTGLSVADEDGRYISKVYDTAEVATLNSASAFTPKYAYFVATNIDRLKVAPVAAEVLGTAGTAAKKAFVQGVLEANPASFLLGGLNIHYIVTIDGVETEGTYTFTGGPYSDMAAVVAAIGSGIPGVVATNVPVATINQLHLETSKSGRLQRLAIKSDGTANSYLGFSASADTDSNTDTAPATQAGHDVEFTDLKGTTLKFTFDQNPHVYEVSFSSNSLDLAISEINEVVGASVASKGGSADKLLLTSPLKGKASQVLVAAGTATTALGLATTASNGTGRPLPNAYLDNSANLVIGSEILRDLVKGFPLDQLSNTATLYVQYKALRKDVSPLAKVPGVLRLPDVDTLSSTLDPLTEDNPAGLACYLMMVNAPGLEVKFLGVDEVSAAAPEGTVAAYARAAGLLETEEVYAIAPLSQDETVHALWKAHVLAMSEPEHGGERIVFVNKKMPVRDNPTVIASGTSANSTTVANQLLLDVNPAAALVAAGVDPTTTIPESAELYLEFTLNGAVVRYSVKTVAGPLLTFRNSFEDASVNEDGFYATSSMDDVVFNAPYSLKLRGDSLIIPGSNPERLDYSLVSETVATANSSYQSRRFYSVFPDTVKTTINGIEKSVPGYYACAATVGMVASKAPQQGFTNYPLVGITGVVGTEKFSKKQLNVMAGGGTYILAQDVPGGAVYCRHQVSTDLTSIESRELSITKVVDFTAKFLRLGIKKFIGTQTISTQLLDTIGATINGILTFLVEIGVLQGANLNNIAQDASQPDTILVDVTLDVPYPCNYIRLTLVV